MLHLPAMVQGHRKTQYRDRCPTAVRCNLHKWRYLVAIHRLTVVPIILQREQTATEMEFQMACRGLRTLRVAAMAALQMVDRLLGL